MSFITLWGLNRFSFGNEERQEISLNDSAARTFEPGSLNMTRLEAFQRCYIDPERYRNHYTIRRRVGGDMCAFSPKAKIAYYMIGKAGSSTARTLMRDAFNSTFRWCNPSDLPDYHQFTFTREPTSRFWSAHSEMMKRWAMRRETHVKIPQKYRTFMEPLRTAKGKFETLFENRNGQERLLASLRLFIDLYDGETPFDGHLRQQVTRLYNATTGRTMPLDAIYELHDAKQQFDHFARRAGLVPPEEEATHAYARKRHLNTTGKLTDEQLRKLCHFSALDYCCLNYKLPEVCRGAFECRWVHKSDIAGDEGLLIESLSPYPPVTSER